MPEFLPFAEFIEKTKDAKPARPNQRGFVLNAAPTFASSAEGRAEIERMRDYVLTYYRGGDIQVPKTYIDSVGNHFDCIPVDQQPAARGIKPDELKERLRPPDYEGLARPLAPLAGAAEAPRAIAPQFGPNTMDQLGQSKECPEGCVPIRRLTLGEITQFPRLQEFFQKLPWRGKQELEQLNANAMGNVPQSLTIADRYHAHAAFYGRPGSDVFLGSGSWMNVWAPDPGPSDFSLSQLWIVATDAAGNALQTIESGWIVSPMRYGPKPIMFIFMTANRYDNASSGWNGYIGNLATASDVTSQSYFVVYDKQSHRYPVGGLLDPSSMTGGETQQGFRMQWQRHPDTKDWWLFAGGDTLGVEPIGFIRHEVFGSGPLGQGTAANVVDFGGEVQNSRRIGAGPMGSGRNAATGFGNAAFQKQITALTSGGPVPAAISPQTPQDCPPNFYTFQVGKDDPSWGNYLFFGGPGSTGA
jgi:hypothetical protein